MWVSPTYDLCSIAWDEWHRMIPSSLAQSNKTEKRINLINGSTFFFRSADRPDSLIGRGVHRLYVDEAARVSEEAMLRSLLPSIADTSGTVLAITTPFGKRNWIYKWFRRGQSTDLRFQEYGYVQGPSTENPSPAIREWVNEMAPIEMGGKGGLPEHIFRQEILAEFLDDAAAVFRHVRECINPLRKSSLLANWKITRPRAMGLDIAKHQDYTVLFGMSPRRLDHDDPSDHASLHYLPKRFHKPGRTVVGWDRFHRLSWPLQRRRVKEAWLAAGKPPLWIDATGVGDAVFDDLRHEGVKVMPYKFTNESKQHLVEGAVVDVESENIDYPHIPSLIQEMEGYEYELTPLARVKYSAPDGEQDDNVIGLCLANHGAKRMAMPLVRFA
jgi:hypothetical protein